MHESSGSLSPSPRSIAHSSTAKVAPTASPVFLARLPEPATEYDHSGFTSFNLVGLTSPNPVGDSGIYLLRTGGLRAPSSPIHGVGLGGLVPHTESPALSGLVPRNERTALGGLVPLAESTALGGLPLTSTAFHGFRTHEPRMSIDLFSDPPGRFVARFLFASPFVNAVPAASRFPLPLTALSIRILPWPPRGSPGSTEAPAAATTIAQPSPLVRGSAQETVSVANPGSTVSISALLGTPAPLSATTLRRTATATGNTGPAGPLDHLPGCPHPAASPTAAADPRRPPRPLLLPPLRSPPYRSRPTVTERGLLGLLYYDLCPLLATRQVHLQI